MAATAGPATATALGFSRGSASTAGIGRGEDGKFLFEFRRAAFRTFGALPIAGAHQDFAVFAAFSAMKLVDWHGTKVARQGKISRMKGAQLPPRRVAMFPTCHFPPSAYISTGQ